MQKTESKPCFLNLDQNKIKKGPKSCGPVMSSQDYLKAPKSYASHGDVGGTP